MIVFPKVWATKSNSEHLRAIFPGVFSLRRTEVVVVQGRHRIPFKVRMPTLNRGRSPPPRPIKTATQQRLVCLEKTIKKTDA